MSASIILNDDGTIDTILLAGGETVHIVQGDEEAFLIHDPHNAPNGLTRYRGPIQVGPRRMYGISKTTPEQAAG